MHPLLCCVRLAQIYFSTLLKQLHGSLNMVQANLIAKCEKITTNTCVHTVSIVTISIFKLDHLQFYYENLVFP